jgi:hypothetical protein
MNPRPFQMVCPQAAQSLPDPSHCPSAERNQQKLLVQLGPCKTCNCQPSNRLGNRRSTWSDSRKPSKLDFHQMQEHKSRARQTARKVHQQSEGNDTGFHRVWRRRETFSPFLQPLATWTRASTLVDAVDQELKRYPNLMKSPARVKEVEPRSTITWMRV